MAAYTIILDSNNPELLDIASDAGITDAVFIAEVNNFKNLAEIIEVLTDKYHQYISDESVIRFIANEMVHSDNTTIYNTADLDTFSYI